MVKVIKGLLIMGQWNFPNANGLGTQGISNSGVETFKGKIMESLTREICQNSLDASNGKKPVKLEFKQSIISKDSFPGYDGLKKCMYDVKKILARTRKQEISRVFYSCLQCS